MKMYERVKPTLQSKSVNLKHPYPDIWGYAKNHAIKKRND